MFPFQGSKIEELYFFFLPTKNFLSYFRTKKEWLPKNVKDVGVLGSKQQ